MTVNHRFEIAWRLDMALCALADWAGPDSPDTHRLIDRLRNLLRPAVTDMPAMGPVTSALQEAVYLMARVEQQLENDDVREQLMDLFYLAQDHIECEPQS